MVQAGEQAAHEGVAGTDGVDDGAQRDRDGRGALGEPGAEDLLRCVAGEEPREVVGAGLDHVGERDQLVDLAADAIGAAHEQRPAVGVVGDGGGTPRALEQPAQHRRAGRHGQCQRARVQGEQRVVEDAGELLVAPLPVRGALDPEVVVDHAVPADGDDRQRRWLRRADREGEVDPIAVQVRADPLAEGVVGDAGEHVHRDAQAGQAHRDVGRAAAWNRLEQALVAGRHEVDQRLAGDHDGSGPVMPFHAVDRCSLPAARVQPRETSSPAMAPVMIATASDILKSRGLITATRRPRRWMWTRSATSNTCGMLWLIRMTGRPRSRTLRIRSSTMWDSLTPSAAVGSSMITTRRPNAALRATATPCRWPPESVSTACRIDWMPILRSCMWPRASACIRRVSSIRNTEPRIPGRRSSRPRNRLSAMSSAGATAKSW